MKKLMVIVSTLLVMSVVFSSCGGSVSLRSEKDSLSYAMGVDFGTFIKNQDVDVDVNVIAAAIRDMLNESQKMERDTAYAFLNEFFMVRKPAREKAAGEEFLANVEKNNRNIQKTESGLLYEIIEPGDPEIKAESDRDKVRVIYEGKLKDGKVFDSSMENGDTAEFALNRVIRGWTEGIKLIGKGGQIKLFIPSDLAYGQHGRQPQIGPNQPLEFDITVVDVIPFEEPQQ